jgi:flagellar basal-body rod modification protein FlgD
MNIDPTSSATGTDTTAERPGLKGTKDEFLKLFMAQLQHQDPFAPTSGADMVAQLAQLSSVEQSKQMSEQLADLAAAQNASANAGLSSLVGRECNANASTFELDAHAGSPPPIDVSTTSPTKGASIVIKNAAGEEIRRIPITDGSKTATVAWDGRDAKGVPVAAGSYEVTVDGGQSASTITTQWHGRVDAVELTPNGPRLRMGNLLVAPGDIRTIGATP